MLFQALRSSVLEAQLGVLGIEIAGE